MAPGGESRWYCRISPVTADTRPTPAPTSAIVETLWVTSLAVAAGVTSMATDISVPTVRRLTTIVIASRTSSTPCTRPDPHPDLPGVHRVEGRHAQVAEEHDDHPDGDEGEHEAGEHVGARHGEHLAEQEVRQLHAGVDAADRRSPRPRTSPSRSPRSPRPGRAAGWPTAPGGAAPSRSLLRARRRARWPRRRRRSRRRPAWRGSSRRRGRPAGAARSTCRRSATARPTHTATASARFMKSVANGSVNQWITAGPRSGRFAETPEPKVASSVSVVSTSAGEPSAWIVRLTASTRSNRRRASARSWVATRIVVPPSHSERNRSNSSSVVGWSTPDSASSSSRWSASWARARARRARWPCPPERAPSERCSSPARPTCSNAAAAAALSADEGRRHHEWNRRRPGQHQLADGDREVGIDVVALGDERRPEPIEAMVALDPVDADRAGVGDEPADGAEHRRLAGTVRADHADQLAVAGGERHVVQRLDLAEPHPRAPRRAAPRRRGRRGRRARERRGGSLAHLQPRPLRSAARLSRWIDR